MIFIACLGLIGLASFNAGQRTKEIGIRKVMGAEVTDIVYLLTREFIILVGLATIPAFIAAWYFMEKWLDTFAYHTALNFCSLLSFYFGYCDYDLYHWIPRIESSSYGSHQIS